MGYAEDLAEARKMKACLERYGVKVSIELQAGAGGSWSLSTFRLIMSHHTASRPSQGNTPCLGIVKRGRSDVPGPLANGYMGYDGIYRILTFGRANHPGAGGPITLDGVRVPKDNGRPYIWGTEFEGGFEPYTEFMHDRMARANTGLTDYFAQRCGATVAAHLEHKTWAPRRKPDRIGYTRESSIARINAVRTNTAPAPTTSEEDDDMPQVFIVKDPKRNDRYVTDGITKTLLPDMKVNDELQKVLGIPFKAMAQYTIDRIPNADVKIPAGLTAEDVKAAVRESLHGIGVTADVNEEELAASVAAKLAGGLKITGEIKAEEN